MPAFKASFSNDKETKSNETVALTDRPESVVEILKAPQRAIENFFNEICVLLGQQMDGSQFSESFKNMRFSIGFSRIVLYNSTRTKGSSIVRSAIPF